MRLFSFVFTFAACASPAEIRDVMKASEVDAAFARARASFPVHETPAYAVVFRISQGRAAACEAHDNA
ncbi:MAG: hypothetical protein HY013_05795, partial [Candidatus Solibacter usitatus]|nr:hypothetical protein [Candidatus Solibacter usitatus]